MALAVNPHDPSDLLFSVNRALWGEVSANMRLIKARAEGSTILLRFYFDGEPSIQDRNSVSCAGSEVISDFPDEYVIEEEIIRLDAPEHLPADPSWITIYMRRESPS